MSSSGDGSNLHTLEKAAEEWEHNSTVLLIDGQHAAYRAFHTRDLSTQDGTPTSVLHGVLEMIQGLCVAANTQRFLVVWDGSDSLNWRRSMWPNYKSRHNRERSEEEIREMQHRIEAIRCCKEGFDELGIPQVIVNEVECDDLIGMLATLCTRFINEAQAASKPERALIISDDKDFMQLVSPTVLVWRGIAGKLVTEEGFHEEHGFTPDLYVDWKALVGEPASGDNIPGVKGIGDLTATKLIQTHGNLDEIVVASKKKVRMAGEKASKRDQNLVSSEEDARLSLRLSRITRDPADIPSDYADHKTIKAAVGSGLKGALVVPRSTTLERLVDFRGKWEFGSLDSARFCKVLGYQMGE